MTESQRHLFHTARRELACVRRVHRLLQRGHPATTDEAVSLVAVHHHNAAMQALNQLPREAQLVVWEEHQAKGRAQAETARR